MNLENMDGNRMPICRQEESRDGALLGSGPSDESPCHPNSSSACPAGAEDKGKASAMKEEETEGVSDTELTPEWKSIQIDYGSGAASTPNIDFVGTDLTKSLNKEI